MITQTNDQLELAFKFLQFTNENVFLTGKAGTGKTTFLNGLRAKSPKRMIIVAPTGVAAINAGGVTIHSFFQISFGPQIPFDSDKTRPVEVPDNGKVAAGIKRFNNEKINIIRSLDLLVIDEISMVRADLLDAVDEVLRRYRNRSKPFGGVQLLMIGDLQQLAPVVKDDEWNILKNYYDTCYFFSSRALKKSDFISIELKQIFRQTDRLFIDLLNSIRINKLDNNVLELLNSRYIPEFNPSDDEGYITLTTHNYQSQQINDLKLNQLKSKLFYFDAVVEGDFPDNIYPTDFKLALKVGAQVMFVKNDPSPEKEFYNGKIGKIVSIDGDIIIIECPGENKQITLQPAEWQNCKYTLNEKTNEIDELVIGTFIQYPLKLAWAITIHKSQGLTFEKAIIDARLSFAHGQVYVALSRCKTLDGMVLSSPIVFESVKNDQTVLQFSNNVEGNQPGQSEFIKAKKKFQLQLITDLFDFKPLYNQIHYLVRKLNEEAVHIQGDLEVRMRDVLLNMQTEIIDIADKFNLQLDRIMIQLEDVEEDQALQDRVKNGCVYFLDKLKTLIENVFENTSFQTDNKAIRKAVAEHIDKIEKIFSAKQACLEAMKNGFSIKNYINARSVAAIEKSENKSLKANAKVLTNYKYPDFYKQILNWRIEKADELNVDIARIIPQKALLEIAQQLPATASELKKIKGIGAKKMQLFGKELLEMIIEYRSHNKMDVPNGIENEIRFTGLNSKQVTFEMFCNGLTIYEIAQARKFAVSTVEGHLMPYVASGQIDLYKIVGYNEAQAIFKVIDSNPNASLGELKNLLGEDFSYSKIKFCIVSRE